MIPTWVIAVAPALIALTGWVVRVLLVDKIASLEKSIENFGKRIGDCETDIKVLAAKHETFRDYSGAVRRDGE